MYRILGSDGKEYGPIPEAQLRQWIREGRAGGATLARLEGNAEWKSLHSLAEFNDVFQTPPVVARGGLSGSLPPVVRTFGVLSLVFGVIGLLYLAFSWFSLALAVRHSANLNFLTAAFYFYQVVGVVGIVIQLACGVGLLRGREWARRLTVYYAIFASLMGIWNLGRTSYWLATTDMSSHLLASPQFLISLLLGVASLVFHIAAIVLLSRPEIRTALTQQNAAQI